MSLATSTVSVKEVPEDHNKKTLNSRTANPASPTLLTYLFLHHLRELSFLSTPHVGSNDPFVFGVLLIHGPQLDLVQLHLESGATFGQHHRAGPFWHVEGVVAEGDEVVLVGHRYHPLAGILRGIVHLDSSNVQSVVL
jgi:hypothetical protein